MLKTLRDRYAQARGKGERWARLHTSLPRRSAKLVWDLFWDAHQRWWTRDERRGEMAPTGDPIALPVPGARDHEVIVRPGTTDAIVYYDCLIDRQYTRALGRSAHRVEAIIDAGANVGMASVAFLVTCPKARVLAIECDPLNAAIARRNLDQFGDRVELVEAALWHGPGRVALATDERGTWAAHVEAAPNGDLATIATEECLTRLGGSVDVVKIDIEGAETSLFDGPLSSAWVSNVRFLLLIEPDTEESARMIDNMVRTRFGFARSYGYRDVIGYSRMG